MEKTIVKFDDIKIAKQKFLRPNSIKTLDIGKMIVSNNVPLGKKGFKYFIGYKDTKKFIPLCIFLPKMGAYRTKYIN